MAIPCFGHNDYPKEYPECNFCGAPGPHTLLETNVKGTHDDFVECKICRLRFYAPRRTFKSLIDCSYGIDEGARKEAETFYQNLSFTPVRDRNAQEKILRSYYGRILSEAQAAAGSIRSLFEIGGSIGFFSHLAKELGIETAGCELNHFAVDMGEKQFGLQNVFRGAFIDYTPTRKYDCVVALDYIEHTYTPYTDLKKMSEMLNPGGAVILKTFLEELDINKSMVAPPCHSHHFFGDVLKSMIAHCGFNLKLWRYDFTNQVVAIGVKL